MSVMCSYYPDQPPARPLRWAVRSTKTSDATIWIADPVFTLRNNSSTMPLTYAGELGDHVCRR